MPVAGSFPSWLEFNPLNRTLVGKAPEDQQVVELYMRLSDQGTRLVRDDSSTAVVKLRLEVRKYAKIKIV